MFTEHTIKPRKITPVQKKDNASCSQYLPTKEFDMRKGGFYHVLPNNFFKIQIKMFFWKNNYPVITYPLKKSNT